MISQLKGNWGEDKAVEYLLEKGYTMVSRNFRCTQGEIDIICIHEDDLIFVEVKNWETMGYSELEYGISPKKQKRMRSVAELFLQKHPQYSVLYKRFDLIFLSGRIGELNHLEHAF
ncbi:MAG: YraN family protein [Spirochaetaceae bacterium]|jgi:putative endonuclease|nr:YraN family protein [Spirochaetaceae bacterium]